MLRYGLAYVCLFLVVLPAGWVMLEMLSDVSFTWLAIGGSPRLHRVGYYTLVSLIVVVWVSGFIVAENWFRVSIDEIRMRRARVEIGSPSKRDVQPVNKLIMLLRKLGLDGLSRRVLVAVGVLLLLVGLKYLCQQWLFYLVSQSVQ